MKKQKIYPLFLFTIMIISCSVFSSIFHQYDMKGKWIVSLTWLCSSDYQSTNGEIKYGFQSNMADTMHGWQPSTPYYGSWQLSNDGTFIQLPYTDRFKFSGTWKLEGNKFTLIYNMEPEATYVGEVNSKGNYMEGTMSSNTGNSGCWNATKN